MAPSDQASGDDARTVALESLPDELARGMAIALWAKTTPQRWAVRAPAGDRTFAELNARCNQLVRALRARGVKAGDGVALICSNRAEFAEVLGATRRAGLRFTPVNWHLTAEEIAYIVDDCDAEVCFVEARFVQAAAAMTKTSRLRHAIAIGGAMHGFTEYESLLGPQPAHDIDDPQLGTQMLYTSGTTGRPKGVNRRAGPPPSAMLSAIGDYATSPTVNLATGPLYHAAPLSFSLGLPHAFGSTVVMMDEWQSEGALRVIEEHRVTHVHMVPTMFHRLLALPEAVRTKYDLSSLRQITHGAAPCAPAVKRDMIAWLGPILFEYYAATEGIGTLVDSETWLRKPGTVGQVTPADHIKILDRDGNELPPGEIGSVYLKAPDDAAFDYYKDPDKTQRAYRGNYYTLEDQGYLDEDGFLFLTDRSADVIISGGVNIYPAEIEAALLAHPAVADACVIGIPSTEWGEEVKAVVSVREGQESSADLGAELIAWCGQRLARFKVPRSVDFLSELPRSESGKLQRRELRQTYRGRLA